MLATLSRETFVKKFLDNRNQRKFPISSVKEYASELRGSDAYAFSRMIPKDVLEDVLKGTRGDNFCNEIIEFLTRVKEGGQDLEAETKLAEEALLKIRGKELLALIRG